MSENKARTVGGGRAALPETDSGANTPRSKNLMQMMRGIDSKLDGLVGRLDRLERGSAAESSSGGGGGGTTESATGDDANYVNVRVGRAKASDAFDMLPDALSEEESVEEGDGASRRRCCPPCCRCRLSSFL